MSDYITGVNTGYADAFDVKSSSLENKINGTDFSKATDDELMSVCKDFESYFIEQVLKSMQKMSKINSEDDDNSSLFTSMASINGESDAGMKTLGGYFGDEMISKYAGIMTESNGGKGLGLAQMLYEQMKRNYAVPAVDGVSE